MKLYSAPLFGLIYNMLKNSESVTFFVIFFKDFFSPFPLPSFVSAFLCIFVYVLSPVRGALFCIASDTQALLLFVLLFAAGKN